MPQVLQRLVTAATVKMTVMMLMMVTKMKMKANMKMKMKLRRKPDEDENEDADHGDDDGRADPPNGMMVHDADSTGNHDNTCEHGVWWLC